MLQTEVVEIKLTFHAKTLFFKSHGIYEIMWKKYCRDGKATDETMALGFARWLPKATYKHSEYGSTYFSSTATMVTQFRFSVTFYVHWLSC